MMSSNELLEKLSPQSLANLGQQHIVYVKPVTIEGDQIFEVHAANGQAIARFADRDVAFEMCQQNDLEPLSVH
jgi:hypothetical protein